MRLMTESSQLALAYGSCNFESFQIMPINHEMHSLSIMISFTYTIGKLHIITR